MARLHLGLVLIFLSYVSSEPKCCMLNQWEGMLYFEIGAVDRGNASGLHTSDQIDLYIINGTVSVSYDENNGRTYLGFDRHTRSARSPPERTRGSLISDYRKGFQYLVYENKTCEKSALTDNMTVYCASDFHTNDNFPAGRIVGDIPVTNMQVLPGFYLSDIYATSYKVIWKIDGSGQNQGFFVMQYPSYIGDKNTSDGRNCMPIYFTVTNIWPRISSAGAGAADVLDIKPGIADPSIFTPPTYCLKQTIEKSKDPMFLWLASFFN